MSVGNEEVPFNFDGRKLLQETFPGVEIAALDPCEPKAEDLTPSRKTVGKTLKKFLMGKRRKR